MPRGPLRYPPRGATRSRRNRRGRVAEVSRVLSTADARTSVPGQNGSFRRSAAGIEGRGSRTGSRAPVVWTPAGTGTIPAYANPRTGRLYSTGSGVLATRATGPPPNLGQSGQAKRRAAWRPMGPTTAPPARTPHAGTAAVGQGTCGRALVTAGTGRFGAGGRFDAFAEGAVGRGSPGQGACGGTWLERPCWSVAVDGSVPREGAESCARFSGARTESGWSPVSGLDGRPTPTVRGQVA